MTSTIPSGMRGSSSRPRPTFDENDAVRRLANWFEDKSRAATHYSSLDLLRELTHPKPIPLSPSGTDELTRSLLKRCVATLLAPALKNCPPFLCIHDGQSTCQLATVKA